MRKTPRHVLNFRFQHLELVIGKEHLTIKEPHHREKPREFVSWFPCLVLRHREKLSCPWVSMRNGSFKVQHVFIDVILIFQVIAGYKSAYLSIGPILLSYSWWTKCCNKWATSKARYLMRYVQRIHVQDMGVSKNRAFSPQIIHFNRVFHYKPSILGSFPPIFGNIHIAHLSYVCLGCHTYRVSFGWKSWAWPVETYKGECKKSTTNICCVYIPAPSKGCQMVPKGCQFTIP